MYKKVFIDQCGYLPGAEKKLTIRCEQPMKFEVLRSDGAGVYGGVADVRIDNKAAGEIDYVGDFSAVTAPGLYYVRTEDNCESEVFAVGEDVYDDVFRKAMDFFYLQRCGMDLPKEACGLFAHPACHTGIGRTLDGSDTRDVTGGWHDAGDYGRYVGPGAMAVAQLLYAYARNEKWAAAYACPDKHAESVFPAYLEECKYELDWMMKMQRADGALYHKASCAHFCSFIMPEDEKEDMIISPVSVTATGDFAAVCAMAVPFYEKYDPAYAAKLAECSKRAYAAMKSMVLPGGFVNPPEITTGEYGDPQDLDERYWAAAELYKTFGDEEYRADFEALAAESLYHGYGWVEMGSYGNLAYLSTDRPVDEALKSRIKASMISLADKILALYEADGYGTALGSKVYPWGSNLDVANNGLHLYDAWKLTGDEKYLRAAGAQIHYLLGRNPMGISYVSDCGTDSIKHPHHRPSGFLGKAMPGMVSGGPCSWLADAVAKGLLSKDVPPAKCFCDMTGSYSTNEVTIYWNSAFLQLLASITE